MATFDVVITIVTEHTYRVDAKSSWVASAKAMMEHVDNAKARKIEEVGEPKIDRPVVVVAEGQEPLPMNDEDSAEEDVPA